MRGISWRTITFDVFLCTVHVRYPACTQSRRARSSSSACIVFRTLGSIIGEGLEPLWRAPGCTVDAVTLGPCRAAPPLSQRAETQSTYLDSLLDSGHTDASASVSSASPVEVRQGPEARTNKNNTSCSSELCQARTSEHAQRQRDSHQVCRLHGTIYNTKYDGVHHNFRNFKHVLELRHTTYYNAALPPHLWHVDAWPSGQRRLIPGFCSTGLLAKRIS